MALNLYFQYQIVTETLNQLAENNEAIIISHTRNSVNGYITTGQIQLCQS